jgi:type II secretory pathway component GspD/PulD (secretin)
MTWLRIGVPSALRVASATIALGIAALAHLPVSAAQDVQTQDVGASGDVLLAGQVELQHLLELAAGRLGLSIQYDRAALQGATTTLRIGAGISDEQLWALTNQLLASHGLTTIHAAGAVAVAPSKPAVFQIVKLPDAAALARLDSELPRFPAPGFTTLRVLIQNRPLKDVTEAAKLLISKPAGAIQEVPGDGSIIVSDLRPRLEQIIELIRAMDDSNNACIIDRIEARYVPATSLAALALAAATASGTLSVVGLQG